MTLSIEISLGSRSGVAKDERPASLPDGLMVVCVGKGRKVGGLKRSTVAAYQGKGKGAELETLEYGH